MKRSQLEATPLGDIVTNDCRTVAILERYGLDYCCGGGRSLAEGCRRQGVDVERVISEISALDSDRQPVQNQNAAALVDYIIGQHHTYVRMTAPLIRQHLAKVAAKHAERHPELSTIAARFDKLVDDLWPHMLKEERMLFPYIRALALAIEMDEPPPPNMFGTIQNPIRMMEIEHEDAGDDLALIRRLTHDYAVPEDACTTFQLVFQELEAFERDLHLHVHLENNVLFPKAIELAEKAELKTRGLKCQGCEEVRDRRHI